jgi:hypothetical protein
MHKADASKGQDKKEGSKRQELTGPTNNGKYETVVSEDSGSFSEISESEKINII